MKKFLRLILGRLFWIGLIVLAEVSAIIIFFVVLQSILEDYSVLVSSITSVAIFVMDLITMIYIVNSKSSNSYKVAWLFVVGLLAFIGVVLYLMFGNKSTTKRMRRKIEPLKNATQQVPTTEKVIQELIEDTQSQEALKISKYISNESGSAIFNHTETRYFKVGEEAWPVMLEELKKAKHYIFMEYFIIEKGEFFNSILDILKEKVKEGVDVRMMYDDVGSISTIATSFPKKMEKCGIKCVAYNRFKPLVNVKVNNRDHRKILVIDGFVGFTGGINLADEYVNKVERFGHWKDNAIMLRGRGVYGLTALFLQNWVASRGGYQELSDNKYAPGNYFRTSEVPSIGYVQPYGDIPFNEESIGQTVYLKLLSVAKKYAYITTPYLIIDDEMQNALCNAAKAGVDVHIVTPHIPDKKMVFNVTRSYYGPLLEAGVHIHEYTPGFIHEKMFVVDDVFGTVGTINLDYRSLYLHLENGVFMYKTEIIKEMKEDYEDTLSKSEEITLERFKKIKRGKTILWALIRVFAPLL